ncbi:tetratricopeptide repeat protein [Palleronia sediminis]|uniref:Tetratricopeptide repeat protein n=1 Tax=Palleronia sediminis TaxID=2547833 RepID=A0A4R5ZYM9_9RHOB|nr:tetratricopeptide repeat protein [Palleronia sediminis]TDL76320.1 tetratricopeptide repeat protein [Palleronia sediminis]
MRHKPFVTLVICALAVSACGDRSDEAEVQRALKDINVIDEANLNEVMMSAADPAEAVAYFRRTATQNPDRPELKRGLARSLVRAKQPAEAAGIWAQVADGPGGTPEDRVELAGALIRAGDWTGAKAQLDRIPPTVETYERYKLEAMVADSKGDWTRADSFYETAAGLTLKPAGILNNWGYSKLSRGDYAAAERLFARALSHDGSLFTAKNNLVLARGSQGNYDLPVVKMTQIEKAQLLHTLALAAIKRGDVATGRSLLEEAVETHPQHFEPAARALAALDANVTN